MRKIKREDEGVSPVIATILMVAITVVLAATLYMMLPKSQDTETTEAMSGRVNEVSDGWVIQIDAGSVAWESDKPMMYNTNTGASHNPSAGTTISAFNSANSDSGTALNIDNSGTDDDVYLIFNDNNGNGDIDGGDSFKITYQGSGTSSMDKNTIADQYEFRVSGTNLAVPLS